MIDLLKPLAVKLLLILVALVLPGLLEAVWFFCKWWWFIKWLVFLWKWRSAIKAAWVIWKYRKSIYNTCKWIWDLVCK